MRKDRNFTAQRYQIVIIDDDAAICKSLKFSLEVEGFTVRTYECAEALLGETVFPVCHCLVIDQKLPGMSGVDLIVELHKRKVLVPAILITTQPSPELKRRAAYSGVPIVEKPLLSSALLDGIRLAIAQPISHPYRRE